MSASIGKQGAAHMRLVDCVAGFANIAWHLLVSGYPALPGNCLLTSLARSVCVGIVAGVSTVCLTFGSCDVLIDYSAGNLSESAHQSAKRLFDSEQSLLDQANTTPAQKKFSLKSRNAAQSLAGVRLRLAGPGLWAGCAASVGQRSYFEEYLGSRS